MQKGFAPILILVGILVIIGVAGGAYYFGKLSIKPSNTQPKACTQEAKQCPDGSFVGRTGPNCEFATCSTTTIPTPDPTANWVLNVSSENIYSFKHPVGWDFVIDIHKKSPDQSLDSFIKGLEDKEEKIPQCNNCFNVLSQTPRVINGYEIRIQDFIATTENRLRRRIRAYILNNNGITIVRISATTIQRALSERTEDSAEPFEPDVIKNFNQILSTFKFTN